LAQEVAACAVAAATRDTRFEPIEERELDAVEIEISVLSPPESIASACELDPKRYGVVVSSGSRRGVLLPDIEGVKSVRDQLRIATAKAGLPSDTPLSLKRFAVLKLKSHALPSLQERIRGRDGQL
jgi:AMMECR1 domain-containing protein